jgi:predicted aspartyl protease
MGSRFDPRSGLIVVHASLAGPIRSARLRMALDTGATNTIINAATLVSAGYDPSSSAGRVEITTGSGVEFATVVSVTGLRALSKRVRNFAVLAHTLPPSAGVDGLIGLDFLRGESLNIDFISGTIGLDPRR